MMQTPRKGSWSLDIIHYPSPVPPAYWAPLIAHLPRGFAEGARRIGIFVDHIAFREVDGFIYTQPIFVGAPEGASTPPKAIFWLISRLHPELRRRTKTAKLVFDRRPWREDLSRWDSELKPANVARYLALQGVDVARESDAGLVSHISECYAALENALYLHGLLTLPSLLPAGDLIAHAQEWTGATAGEILQDVAGASSATRGWSPEVDPLVSGLRKSADAQRSLGGDDPAAVLASLQALPDPLGAATRDYVAHVGHRVVCGYDLSQPTLQEVPRLFVEIIRSHLQTSQEPSKPSPSVIRDRVPDRHRATFDALLEEARYISRLRDERAVYNDIWASGILRRAVLEAGRRLSKAGALEDPVHLIDASIDEMRALLEKRPSVGAKELAARSNRRADLSLRPAPLTLGGSPPPLPPVDWFPPDARRAIRANFAFVQSLYDDAKPSAHGDRFTGIGVSRGVYEGTARVVKSPEDVARVRKGEILVAPTTSPAYGSALGLIGAVVTDRGGALTHAAIIAREYGIPGVVGTRDGTSRIPDGARLRVDGTSGEVRILS